MSQQGEVSSEEIARYLTEDLELPFASLEDAYQEVEGLVGFLEENGLLRELA